MSTSLRAFGSDGNPVSAIGREHLGIDASVELFDPDGFRVPQTEIPDSSYFPDLSVFEPTPEESSQGALALANAALQRVLRKANAAVDAVCGVYDRGGRPHPTILHAISELDEELRAFATIASVDSDDREPHPLELLNADRTAARNVRDRANVKWLDLAGNDDPGLESWAS